MAEELVPPVVAVVVSSDPGPWLEECLLALKTQDYPNLSLLVVDAASSEPLVERIAAVAPDAYVRRLEENLGYGPSANAVLGLVEGSTHYLFCHDDVILDPDCVRRLTEEAFRSNAGVVGPKLVDYHEEDRILQLGLGVDRFGAPVRRVERMEFDQAQHDEVREVFAVPGACTLIRSDLFAALGGFDPQISMFGEDVDFCWRARLAGARAVVVPTAYARHLEATSARLRPLPEARALQWRHELRAVLKNYGRLRRPVIVAQLATLSLVEVVYFSIVRRRSRARQVVDAWRWNLASARGLRAAREAVASSRRVTDHGVAHFFTRRSFRLSRSLRVLAEEWLASFGESGRAAAARRLEHLRRGDRRSRQLTVAAGVLLLVVVFGSRSLVAGHLPVIGGLGPPPAPTELLARFFGGTTELGTQAPGPAPLAYGLLGLGGIVLIGSTAQLVKVLVVAFVVLGAVGVARLVRPFGPAVARYAAAITYLFLPLAWNDLARGDLPALAAYAGTPFMLSRMMRASGLPPYREQRVDLADVCAFGLLLAAVGAFAPVVVLMSVVLGVLLVASAALAGEWRRCGRGLALCGGGFAVAFAVAFPWSLLFLQPGAKLSVLLGAASGPAVSPSLAALARMQLGPLGAGLLGFSFLAASLLVLLLAQGERLSWATRLWCVALGTLAVAVALNEGWLGSGGGALRVVLAPFAVALAALVGIGVGALRADVGNAEIGLSHAAGMAFAILVLAGLLPVLGASAGGRWGLPANGYEAVLGWMRPTPAATTLWLGDPASFPLASYEVAPGFAAGVARVGLPGTARQWPSPSEGTTARLVAAVEGAEAGATVRLGSELAPYGVRYLVVPDALAPVLPGEQSAPPAPPPPGLLAALGAQDDLHQLPSEGGATVFLNAAWRPAHPRPASGTPAFVRALGVGLGLAATAGSVAVVVLSRRRRRRPGRAERTASHPSAAEPAPELVAG